MLTIRDELPQGAYVNVGQVRIMQDFFRINAWSYVAENPFELCERLDNIENNIKNELRKGL